MHPFGASDPRISCRAGVGQDRSTPSLWRSSSVISEVHACDRHDEGSGHPPTEPQNVLRRTGIVTLATIGVPIQTGMIASHRRGHRTSRWRPGSRRSAPSSARRSSATGREGARAGDAPRVRRHDGAGLLARPSAPGARDHARRSSPSGESRARVRLDTKTHRVGGCRQARAPHEPSPLGFRSPGHLRLWAVPVLGAWSNLPTGVAAVKCRCRESPHRAGIATRQPARHRAHRLGD
jgi:hypothetical protein